MSKSLQLFKKKKQKNLKDLVQATAFHMQTFPVHNFINPTFPRII